jgi:hypothetical protein
MSDDASADDDAPEPRLNEADLERAIAVAERAGLRGYRIEIAVDGTISIVVGSPDAPEAPQPA